MKKEVGKIVTMELEKFNEEVEKIIVEEVVKDLEEDFGDKLDKDSIVFRSMPNIAFKDKKTGEVINENLYLNSPFIKKENYEVIDTMMIGVKGTVEVEE
jgi:hypothetical protein